MCQAVSTGRFEMFARFSKWFSIHFRTKSGRQCIFGLHLLLLRKKKKFIRHHLNNGLRRCVCVCVVFVKKKYHHLKFCLSNSFDLPQFHYWRSFRLVGLFGSGLSRTKRRQLLENLVHRSRKSCNFRNLNTEMRSFGGQFIVDWSVCSFEHDYADLQTEKTLYGKQSRLVAVALIFGLATAFSKWDTVLRKLLETLTWLFSNDSSGIEAYNTRSVDRHSISLTSLCVRSDAKWSQIKRAKAENNFKWLDHSGK